MNDPNNTQRNRGYAFLELETPKDAQIAFKKFQKKDVIGKLKGMKVAWAEPLDEPDEEDMLKVCQIRCLVYEPKYESSMCSSPLYHLIFSEQRDSNL